MRTINLTHRFKKDYKRELRGQHRSILETSFWGVVDVIALDESLADRFRDHALTGIWTDHRDCHIKPDLVLIYRFPDVFSVELVRLGSHSELGL